MPPEDILKPARVAHQRVAGGEGIHFHRPLVLSGVGQKESHPRECQHKRPESPDLRPYPERFEQLLPRLVTDAQPVGRDTKSGEAQGKPVSMACLPADGDAFLGQTSNLSVRFQRFASVLQA